MEKKWIFLIAVLIFLTCIFLFWKLTGAYAKKGYGTKMWKHGSTRLSYWQAAILYSITFTALIMFLLKWADVFTV